MTFLAVLLALPVFAQRVALPRAMPRAAIPAMAPSFPAASLAPAAFGVVPSLAPMPALAPAPAAPADAPAPDGLLGKTAKAIASTDPASPEWEREVFEEMFTGRYKGPKPWSDIPGSPKVAVGGTLVDRRAPGARLILRSLTLPHETPVLGLFKREGEGIVNGFVLGTQGVRGHKDALPQGADKQALGGYTLGLRRDGRLLLAGSGHLPADLTPRLLRNLKRYYGLSPAMESGLQRLGRWWFAFWDGLSAFLRER